MGFVVVLTLFAAAMILTLGLMPMPELLLPVVALLGGLAMGASRTPRDIMLQDASPPGQISKVFGFVSSGLPLGSAVMPVPLGFPIDLGHPELVLPAVAANLVLSLFCAATAQTEARSRRGVRPAPAE
jgi:MFS family permease